MSGRRGLSDDELAVWATFTRKIKTLQPARTAAKAAASAEVAPPRRVGTAVGAALEWSLMASDPRVVWGRPAEVRRRGERDD